MANERVRETPPPIPMAPAAVGAAEHALAIVSVASMTPSAFFKKLTNANKAANAAVARQIQVQAAAAAATAAASGVIGQLVGAAGAVSALANPLGLPNASLSAALGSGALTPFGDDVIGPVENGKCDVEVDGQQTDITTDATYWAGRTWKEYAAGDISGTFKWESEWRAEMPIYPPQLIVNAIYGFIAYMQNPLHLPDPTNNPAWNGVLPLGVLLNCYAFAAMVKKSGCATDKKSGITAWKPDLAVTGPIVYFDALGRIVGP